MPVELWLCLVLIFFWLPRSASQSPPTESDPIPEAPSGDLDEDTRDDLRRFIRVQVRSRTSNKNEVVAASVDYLEGQVDPDVAEDFAEEYTREEIAELRSEMKTWPLTTDCDRLDKAFADLAMSQILAKQDYQCCQTCGHAAMAAEMKLLTETGEAVRGYVFYHNQDTERAVEGDGLLLAYGASPGGEADSLQVAKEVVRVLRAHGLETDWDESVEKRIFVEMDWKRRLATGVPPN